MEDKPKMLNIKNFIKQESGRLPSFVSRDLSLGGSKIKKVYAPNLNAVRNKANKPTVVVGEKAQKQQAKPRVQRRQNNDGRFVQSSGVFSEGTANIKRPTLYSNKHASVREQETSAGIVKPKVARTWKIDVKEEASVVRDLLGCDDDSEEEADCEYQPIVLPLSANRDGFLNHFRAKKEVEVKVKREENVDGESSSYRSATPSFVCGKMYDDENPTLSLLKLPDSLPGKGFDENDKTSDCTLGHLLEGQIGKMLVRKSGRVDFIIGSTAYNVDTVEAAEFDEDVVAVPTDGEQHVVNVGPIDQKYVVSPDWTALLGFK